MNSSVPTKSGSGSYRTEPSVPIAAVPFDGSPTFRIDSGSPSASVSLSVTGMSIEVPTTVSARSSRSSGAVLRSEPMISIVMVACDSRPPMSAMR